MGRSSGFGWRGRAARPTSPRYSEGLSRHMIFARKVWAILVGIKDGFTLLFLLLFFWALYAVLTARPNPGLVREGALLLELDGTVVEEPAKPDPFALLLGQQAPAREYRERDLVRAIEAAAEDDRIKA